MSKMRQHNGICGGGASQETQKAISERLAIAYQYIYMVDCIITNQWYFN